MVETVGSVTQTVGWKHNALIHQRRTGAVKILDEPAEMVVVAIASAVISSHIIRLCKHQLIGIVLQNLPRTVEAEHAALPARSPLSRCWYQESKLSGFCATMFT